MSIQAINDTGFAILSQAGPQNSSFPPQLLPSPNAMRPASSPADPHHLPPPPLQIPVDQLRMGSPLSASVPPPNGPHFSTTAQPVDAMSLSANYYPSANASTRLPPILQPKLHRILRLKSSKSPLRLLSWQALLEDGTKLSSLAQSQDVGPRLQDASIYVVIYALILKNVPLSVIGLGAKRGLRVNTIASACIRYFFAFGTLTTRNRRHQALHTAKPQSNVCQGCKKTFSRLDALNRHLRSDGGAECREKPKVKADPGAVTTQLAAGTMTRPYRD
ncbi:hypothetical protein MPER_08101 [Moniliophthora perniciosa FA553]|nr:hypothetical protein MPER_08101 [Moniliophthora perniciosa FA553]